jgi:hypothetical protein
MARPKSKRPNRDDSATFKCTYLEKEAYQRAADETGQSMSDWIRLLLRADLDRLGIKIRNPEDDQA